MSYPQEVWEEGVLDAIKVTKKYMDEMLQEREDRLTPKQKALLVDFQKELIERLNVNFCV